MKELAICALVCAIGAAQTKEDYERVIAAHMVRHLHLNDIGAPVGKLAARRRPGPDLREIDDAKAFKGGGGGQVRHRSGLAIGAGMRWRLQW